MKNSVRKPVRPQVFATVKLRFSGLQFKETRGQQDTQVENEGGEILLRSRSRKHMQNDHDYNPRIFSYIIGFSR